MMRQMPDTGIRVRLLLLVLTVTTLVVACGNKENNVTSPSPTTLAGTVWSGPFTDRELGTGTLTLTFGLTSVAPGRWALTTNDVTQLAAFRVLPPASTDNAGTVTLALATAVLDPDCDILLSARISGSQMDGTMRIGRCDPQGEHAAPVRLSRR